MPILRGEHGRALGHLDPGPCRSAAPSTTKFTNLWGGQVSRTEDDMGSDNAHEDLRELPHEPVRAGGHAALRKQVLAVLAAHAQISVPDRDDAALEGMDDHLFFAWCDDVDGLFLAAVPETAIPSAVVSAIREVKSARFAGAEDFRPSAFAGLLRIMACAMSPLGVEHAHAEALVPWIEMETRSWSDEDRALLPTVDELRALDGAWASYFSMSPASFDRRYSRVLAIRKMS